MFSIKNENKVKQCNNNASSKSPSVAKRVERLAAAALIASAVSFPFITSPLTAHADELSDAKSKLSGVQNELKDKTRSISELHDEIDSLSKQINDNAEQIVEKQELIARYMDDKTNLAVIMYKTGNNGALVNAIVGSETISELSDKLDAANQLFEHADDLQRTLEQERDELEQKTSKLSAMVDEKKSMTESLNADKESLESEASELSDDIKKKSSTSSSENGQPFKTSDSCDWKTGVASGYGGHGDASIADNQRTATGAAVTETSMGVAIPMAWGNTSKYYGKKVEISYNGRSVIATINDCGGMGGGSRSLDLQPGVFKAFGFSDCNSWGLRTVKYRFI